LSSVAAAEVDREVVEEQRGVVSGAETELDFGLDLAFV